MFIFLIGRKATEALIRRVTDYHDLLSEMPKYCCKLEIIYFSFIEICLKFRTACQNRQAEESAVKCLSQGYNKTARVKF